jgi:hypothetical protein
MEYFLSWWANSGLALQDILHFLSSPKDHYFVRRNPQSIPPSPEPYKPNLHPHALFL